MILRSPLSIPPNLIAGPRKVGDETDYIELNPADGQINVGGAASPLTINALQYTGHWPVVQSGEYTSGIGGRSTGFGANFSANMLYAIPCPLHVRQTFDAMAIVVSTGQAGAKIRLGVYADDNSNPGVLLAEATASGEIDGSTSGVKTALFTTPQTIGPGLVWLAYFVNNGNVFVVTGNAGDAFNVTMISTGSNLALVTYVYRAFTYGTMPNPFGSATRDTSGFPPLPVLRTQ